MAPAGTASIQNIPTPALTPPELILHLGTSAAMTVTVRLSLPHHNQLHFCSIILDRQQLLPDVPQYR